MRPQREAVQHTGGMVLHHPLMQQRGLGMTDCGATGSGGFPNPGVFEWKSETEAAYESRDSVTVSDSCRRKTNRESGLARCFPESPGAESIRASAHGEAQRPLTPTQTSLCAHASQLTEHGELLRKMIDQAADGGHQPAPCREGHVDGFRSG